MKKYLLSIALITSFIATSNVLAAPKSFIKGGRCISNPATSNSSIFSCEHIGDVTINQIYEKGWRIVNYIQDSQYRSTVILIIEQQG